MKFLYKLQTKAIHLTTLRQFCLKYFSESFGIETDFFLRKQIKNILLMLPDIRNIFRYLDSQLPYMYIQQTFSEFW